MSDTTTFLTAPKAAAKLGLPVRTLIRWAREGKIPCVDMGHGTRHFRPRFKLADVEKALHALPAKDPETETTSAPEVL